VRQSGSVSATTWRRSVIAATATRSAPPRTEPRERASSGSPDRHGFSLLLRPAQPG
jgi:hypothetical protein